MKLFIASDHAGYALKEHLASYFALAGHEVEDCGAYELEEDDDYPDFVISCARQVAATPNAFGIVVGASGQGEAMAANRVPGARAAVYYGAARGPQTDASGATLSLISSVRAHNNANILSLGARFITEAEAEAAIEEFLTVPFEAEERHLRRIKKLG